MNETRQSYSVAVKDHIMIAHSLKGETFGPAQGLHGATYHVIAEFTTRELNSDGIVIDIGLALEVLQTVLKRYNYQNLDTLEDLRGHNTTTEFLCAHIHEAMAAKIAGHFRGDLKITLEESHVAWASYTAPVGGD